MIAITTRYLGPTDHRGGRVAATFRLAFQPKHLNVQVVVPYDHALDSQSAHFKAALACLEKYNQNLIDAGFGDSQRSTSFMLRTETPDGRGWTWVAMTDHERAELWSGKPVGGIDP